MRSRVFKMLFGLLILVIIILIGLLYKSKQRITVLEMQESSLSNQKDFIKIYELLNFEGIYNDNPTQEQINLQKVDSILGRHLHAPGKN